MVHNEILFYQYKIVIYIVILVYFCKFLNVTVKFKMLIEKVTVTSHSQDRETLPLNHFWFLDNISCI